jgi:hypothetical protein
MNNFAFFIQNEAKEKRELLDVKGKSNLHTYS